ncbi:poly-gamma-glutamate synthesis protein (capsule biosynthesis protein) [Aminobacter lissarensis]|uniref:Poly-gamma-glutamate synthesis protein (Capsule biosynthesis protein) n=1 Tax=Aminobacter carboxidus TaxID=376165 RepID=A0A8E1WJX5_9HYPH|nr:CapA family protein [Aminobacter lissarensis]MBB6469863.1 poly-gamma-glutamate synthesis protein (capsule biosynthesis protein) [Aminobacter lissarensis]
MPTLAVTGDVIPLDHLRPDAQAPEVQAVLRHLHDADLVIGNFEMPLTCAETPLQKLLNIRADPSIASDLDALGLDIVTVANNHTVDYGCEGLKDTVENLRATGLQVVGAGETLTEAVTPAAAFLGSKRVGVLAFSCLVPTGMGAAERRAGISGLKIVTSYEIDPYYQMEEPGDLSAVRVRTRVHDDDMEFASRCVRDCRSRFDFLIVTVHWGFGSGDDLAEYQRPLAHALIEAGADMIHGHHPHAIHPIEFYRNKPILYGLGTLVGQQVFMEAAPTIKKLWSEMSAEGFVALLCPHSSADPQVQLVPHILNARRLPGLAKGAELDRLLSRLKRLSSPFGTKIEVRNGEIIARKENP